MKFAKELEDEAVPEWRQGKKKIKAISKALRNINRTPSTPARPALVPEDSSERIPFTHYDFTRPRPKTSNTTHSLPEIEEVAPENERAGSPRPTLEQTESRTWFAQSPPILIPGGPSQDASKLPTPERTPLANAQTNQNRWQTRYGSIIGTPPDDEGETPGHFAALELPDPAISPVVPDRNETVSAESSGQQVMKLPEAAQIPRAPDAYHVGETTPPAKRSLRGSIARRMFRAGNADKDTKGQSSSLSESHTFPRSRIRRLFTAQALDQPTVNDVQLEAYRELDARQGEFFFFLDKELDKIETFYRMKEEEASARLQVLRKQLHEMRDRRLAEILKDQKPQRGTSQELPDGAYVNGPGGKENGQANGSGPNFLKKPIEDALGRRHAPGKTSKAMQKLSSPPGPNAQRRIEDAKQDYVRRKPHDDVPYRFAKRRLKLALQEFYRGLELLKSYAILNRTGFRKINKKYDKAVQARPPLRYMAEKVNNAYFVQSDVIDNHLVAVEDLYSRYFERGNHKIAVRKLRSKLGAGDQSGTTFRNGLYVAAGVCFGISGLVNASDHLFGADPVIKLQTSYLLQIYAGYFLALLLFLLFCLDCRIWTQSHINYVFVFEYDTRHVLDWRQLSEIPCFFLLLNGLFLYLNFQLDASGSFYVYWPVILIFLTLLIMVLPFRILYHRARRWWGYSNLRLLLAGLYPVEFRDFYLGDMYCSETYAMGQIEAFFCLYANGWKDPPQCNSNHSRLLGFFTTLPAIWRALQCLRRYYDSRNWFPHLANFMKYCCNILYYMTLSLYRIDRSDTLHAVFITFAAINGVYCAFWDVYLDFSLGNFWAKHFFLRDQLAYKKVWVYYFAIIADVVLRQQWVFYAIFTQDLQHSALMSFFVSLAEVLRRGMWSLFRVENEHCNNVGKFRASRDIPLPYEITESPEVTGKLVSPEDARRAPGTPATIGQADGHVATGADLERQSTRDSSLRLRKSKTPSGGAPLTPGMQALRRVGTVIASAHAQDFQKRRRPETESQGLVDDEASYAEGGADSDEEDEEDEDDGGYDEVAELRRQQAEDIESASSARVRRVG
ncbi:Xenotropic and polytropic retrovirus receptor 1 [Knufia peltigerae]|uniref:Xenotropic and polytropic retrovirus receptor 1 n=1 Tax=Knufia peltigerae TaxID=1002370 RepID=A0AA38XU27_9EURO|nr:Xenotropic and polytropic retrovirus receptor 1 [Knufia peltigerae]